MLRGCAVQFLQVVDVGLQAVDVSQNRAPMRGELLELDRNFGIGGIVAVL